MREKLTAADQVLADCLGEIIAEQRAVWEREWRLQMQVIAAESRATIAEIRSAAIEALMTANAPAEAFERLRAISGGRAS